jgi:hypothetical protein
VGAFAMTSSLANSSFPRQSLVTINTNEENSNIRTFVTVLSVIAKIFWLLLLFGFLLVTTLVWIWLASFRFGSRFGAWIYSFWTADSQEETTKLTLGLLTSSILAIFTPLAVFGDWSQEVISEKFQISFLPTIKLKEVIKTQLGIPVPENSLCLPELSSDTNLQQAANSSLLD